MLWVRVWFIAKAPVIVRRLFVQPLEVHRRGVALVGLAGFEKDDAARGPVSEAAGDDGSGGAAADDQVIAINRHVHTLGRAHECCQLLPEIGRLHVRLCRSGGSAEVRLVQCAFGQQDALGRAQR